MKKIVSIIIVAILLIGLTACGAKIDPTDPNQGLWTATTGEMFGLSIEVEEFFGQGFTIELQSKGKCTINVDGKKASGKWTLDSRAFTVKGGGIDCAGRLENGKLTLEDVMGMGLDLIFEKEGRRPNTANARRTEADHEPTEVNYDIPADVGYYVIDSITQEGETYDSDTLKEMDIDYYIRLNEDGSAEINTDILIEGTWEPGQIDYIEDGEDVFSQYVLSGDTLTLELGNADITLVFKRSSAPTDSSKVNAEEMSNLQQMWNGTWFGVLAVNSGTGKYDEDLDDEDAYMVIDANAEGEGAFSIYLSDMEEWVSGTCQVYDYGFDVIDGEYLNSSEPLKLSEWIFRPSPLYKDNYTVTADYVDDENDSFTFTMFFKPWGADWDEEIDFGKAATYPPSYYDYIEKVNNGEPSPFDDGGNAQSSSDPGNEEPKKTDDASDHNGSGATDISYELVDYTLSLTFPSGDWIDKGITGGASGGVTTAHFYYKETHANAPRVEISESFTMSSFDSYQSRWTDYEDIESKTIGGIEMKGRTYTAYGMKWIDYIAELGEKQFLGVTIIDLDPDDGETKALIDSITIR